MQINHTHVTYCTNIHPGESWHAHFNELQTNLPTIKAAVRPKGLMGLGLRLSRKAAEELAQPESLHIFKSWLSEHDLYVFTMNGFPYGDFHTDRVKDQVHFPDWSTTDRLHYTKLLFKILSELLPAGIDGGISTSPLSYGFWEQSQQATHREKCTQQILDIADFLSQLENSRGQYMHLDIEPEPDGLIEDFPQFMEWYTEELLPAAETYFAGKYDASPEQAHAIVQRHICLCYDICHFALAYQNHQQCILKLQQANIRVGKIQVSSALKGVISENIEQTKRGLEKLKEFDEPIYLHQVIVQKNDGTLEKYRDLPEFLSQAPPANAAQWRSHFHVPIFLEDYGELRSTQSDVLEVLEWHKAHTLSPHIEVETYTWNVLPPGLRIPLQTSIVRELQWLIEQLKN